MFHWIGKCLNWLPYTFHWNHCGENILLLKLGLKLRFKDAEVSRNVRIHERWTMFKLATSHSVNWIQWKVFTENSMFKLYIRQSPLHPAFSITLPGESSFTSPTYTIHKSCINVLYTQYTLLPCRATHNAIWTGHVTMLPAVVHIRTLYIVHSSMGSDSIQLDNPS